MKKLKKLCGAVLIAGLMLPQIAMGSIDTAEAASGKWKQDGKKWWYSYSDGTYPKSKWEKIGGKWYHFDKSGYMQTGWQKISGNWYYFGTNGIMKTGWQKISGKWYYFNGSGSMATGRKTIKGVEYTFRSDGLWVENAASDSTGFSEAKVGDVISFGKYEQDNNTANGQEMIEWIVLDRKQDGSLLVISKYALYSGPYNTECIDVTWETCTLRKWLNSTFLNAAFTSDEKAMILKTTIKNNDNPTYGTDGGNDTKDQVFLLSIDEAERYFKNDDTDLGRLKGASIARACQITEYAKAQGAWACEVTEYAKKQGADDSKYYCIWWLRSPAGGPEKVAEVINEGCVGGDIHDKGNYVDTVNIAIRPAMWIKP